MAQKYLLWEYTKLNRHQVISWDGEDASEISMSSIFVKPENFC